MAKNGEQKYKFNSAKKIKKKKTEKHKIEQKERLNTATTGMTRQTNHWGKRHNCLNEN